MIDDFLEVLSGVPEPRVWVQAACIAYLADPPRTAAGAPRRPSPGDLLRLATRLAANAAAARLPRPEPIPEPERVRCSPERVIEIMVESGFITEAEARRRVAEVAVAAGDPALAFAFAPKRIPRSGEE